MLDKRHKDIDAVVISTPDHTHFAATLAAMERGIHVCVQKPLTHNIWQARTLLKAKERYKPVTQMGNQGHAGTGIRESDITGRMEIGPTMLSARHRSAGQIRNRASGDQQRME